MIILLGLSFRPFVSNYINYKIPIKNQVYGFLRNRGYDVLYDSTPLEAISNIPEVLFRDKLSPPKVYIDITFPNLSSINETRSKALSIGMHVRSEKDDWAKAKLSFNNKEMNIKVRLKGDSMDHWFTNKWSLKIDIKGNDHFMGMRKFAFQHPVTRAFQAEKMVQDTMRNYGILSPRYQFINLIINGENKGIMAVEESFDTELLEYNTRKDGVIFKLDETNAVIEKINPGAFNNLELYDSFHTTHIEAFNSSKYKNNEQLRSQLSIAQGLFGGFMRGSLEPSKVFDIEKTSKFLAILEIFGAAHTVDWRNIRFYLNPYSLKIEPISYDSSITDPALIGAVANTELGKALLNDKLILDNFLYQLTNISRSILDTNWLNELARKDQEIMKSFGNEFIFLREFPVSRFENRITQIMDNPENSIPYPQAYDSAGKEPYSFEGIDWDEYLKLFTEPFFALHRYQKEGVVFEIYNPTPKVIEIHSISPIFAENEDSTSNLLDKKISVSPLGKRNEHNFYSLNLPFAVAPNALNKWNISASITGAEREYKIESHEYNFNFQNHPLEPHEPKLITSEHQFIEYNSLNNTFNISKGTWFIKKSIIFPEKSMLIIEAGSNITVKEDAFLLINGAILFQGTQEEPIVFRSESNDKYWQGLIVMNAQEESIVDFTSFKNTQSVKKNGWLLTGAITFFNSDVSINNTNFINNIAEDSLNIVKSDFVINNTFFKNASSDFFDSDYSNGEIINLSMDGSVGDGLDLSGSKVKLLNSNFTNIRDKAISVGEGSSINISDAEISNVGTGIAIKDSSNAYAANISIVDANYSGVAVYNKKPVYGSSTAIIKNINLVNFEYDYIVQTGNSLKVDSSNIQTQDINVDLLYETIMKKNIN